MTTRKQEKANQKYMDDRFEDEYNNDIDILIDSLESNLNEIGDMSELSTADLSGHEYTYLSYSQFEIELLKYIRAKSDPTEISYAERNEQRRQEIVAADSSYTLDMLEQMSNDDMTDLHISLCYGPIIDNVMYAPGTTEAEAEARAELAELEKELA